MRILQILNVFPPALSLGGGAMRVAYNISKELCKRDHRITVFTTNALDMEKTFKVEHNPQTVSGIRVWYFKNLIYKPPYVYLSFELMKSIREKLKNFDIVHLHDLRSYLTAITHHHAMRYNIPYVLQTHGQLPRIMAWRRLKWFFDVLFGYRLLRDASKVIALNRMEAEQYRSMGVPEEKIAIIPNGIDLSEYAELPPKGAFKKKFNIPEDKKVILYLGRIHKTKGIDFLVRAYAYLIKKMKCKDVVLVIAGPDDGYRNEARALANSLGVYSSTVFTGFISNSDKLAALVDANVFVTPSFYGFPMTFLEACAVGTPIITTSLGDTLEWIDGKVGYVTQPRPQDLAEAIYRIISNDRLRRNFSRSCIKIVKSKFSIEKVVEKLEKVYEEIVAE